ncbi:hypothetical protein [Xanthomonas sacchari]|uniref:hypothetical protein n=1 Tax=Xanthomonas sacchari TaxID=56458 RepID=UPI003526DEC0
MDFNNRVKKELTEAVVRAILVDAGYRVLDFGIESQIREIECLSALEYLGLDFPAALRSLPDLLVMDREQTQKQLVEVKFRTGWDKNLLLNIEDQVRMFNSMVLIYLNTQPQLNGRDPSPSSYLRCCQLRISSDVYQVEVLHGAEFLWRDVAQLGVHEGQWWGLRRLQDVFPKIIGRAEAQSLQTAINSIKGLIDA